MTLPAPPSIDEYEDPFVMNTTNVTSHPAAYDEQYALDLVVPLTVTYVIIFVAGILGNTSTCVVIARNRSMHTATNFYLFSLAISDLILLVCGLPFEVHRLWNPDTYPLGEAHCIAIGLASETSANATVLTITAFTVERYIAICRPFMSHTMSKLSRAVRFIIAIWVLALCTAVPQAMQFGIVSYVDNGVNVSACTVKGVGVHQVFVISSFVFFVVPMSMISVLYALIGIKLRTSRVLHPVKKLSVESNERASGQMQYRNGASQRRVIRMLVAVALSFFICWAPFHVQRLLAIYGKSLEHPSDTFYLVYIVLTFLSGVLYFLSTAINPFLYNIMSNKFRNAFKVTLATWCGRGGPRMGRSYSALLASQRLRAGGPGACASVRGGTRRLRRLSTATTQLYDAPPRAQVLCALSFLATGSYQKIVGVGQHLTQRTTSRCIREVVNALNHNWMVSRWIVFPQMPHERSLIKENATTGAIYQPLTSPRAGMGIGLERGASGSTTPPTPSTPLEASPTPVFARSTTSSPARSWPPTCTT